MEIGMDAKISVIVPVYNVAPYIRECLQSIARQTFREYEVLMVDDGSTDESGSIAQEYADTYEHFYLIHKENGGLSSARNAGLKHAKGEYVCFVDSDDYITHDYLEKLYARAQETNADMVIADYREVDELGHALIKKLGEAPKTGRMDREKLLMALTSVGECHYATTIIVAWNKLVRTELMRKHPYPKDVLHEDEFVIMPLLLECNHVEWLDEVVYAYRQRKGSIMQDSEAAMKHLQVLTAYRERIDLCRKLQMPELNNAMKRAYFWNIEIWYYLMRRKYNIPSQKLRKTFSKRMWGALICYHGILGKRKTLEYISFAISPEYYLENYFK